LYRICTILQGLGLKSLINAFLNKVEDALHVNGIDKQLEMLFDPKQLKNSYTALSSLAISTSKVHEVSKQLIASYVCNYI